MEAEGNTGLCWCPQMAQRALALELLSPDRGTISSYHLALAKLHLLRGEHDSAEASLKEALTDHFQVCIFPCPFYRFDLRRTSNSLFLLLTESRHMGPVGSLALREGRLRSGSELLRADAGFCAGRLGHTLHLPSLGLHLSAERRSEFRSSALEYFSKADLMCASLPL